MLALNEVHCGDCLDLLPLIPDASVHCVVTSPPYWGLRDYGVDNQIGLEETFDEWLEKMVAVFREVRRVLRPDGTFWLNIGDSYAQSESGAGANNTDHKDANQYEYGEAFRSAKYSGQKNPRTAIGNLKPKDLIGQPWALAFALRDDGWWLRSDIIWTKPNPMPESVTDRPTKSHEHVFLLAKSAKYFYDADAVREKTIWKDDKRADKGHIDYNGKRKGESGTGQRAFVSINSAGRNLRDVWTIATQAFPEAHFATFPEKLPKLCIMAGTSERGCCPDCGAPWERIIEKGALLGKDRGGNYKNREIDKSVNKNYGTPGLQYQNQTLGWQPKCNCGIPAGIPATVLDPFAGAGTTCMVARKLGRNFIGIELSEEYCEIARKRIEKETRQERLKL